MAYVESCNCPACTALADEYLSDPEMLQFLRRKLLIRGWAGKYSPTEHAYVLAHSADAQRKQAGFLARNPLTRQAGTGMDVSLEV